MSNTVPVPRHLVLRLTHAIVGITVFLVVSTVHGAVLSDFDSWHQSVSALALAPYGSIQVINFFVLGASLLSTVPVWRRVLSGGKARRRRSCGGLVGGVDAHCRVPLVARRKLARVGDVHARAGNAHGCVQRHLRRLEHQAHRIGRHLRAPRDPAAGDLGRQLPESPVDRPTVHAGTAGTRIRGCGSGRSS